MGESLLRHLGPLVLFHLCGCGWLPDTECGAPSPPPPDDTRTEIQKALDYLAFTQLQTDRRAVNQFDYAGDWPQCFTFGEDPPFFREASPFMATFVHRALTLIREPNRSALGLTDSDLATAASMRTRAVDLVQRFRAPDTCPDAGTYGFWPHEPAFRLPPDVFLASIFNELLVGPEFMGQRPPINLAYFPPDMAVPTDADVTATVYAALLDHALYDGGATVDEPPTRFFSDWRDLGQVPRRFNPGWLPPESGAFLTWLAYHDDPTAPNINDVDVVVNANVLYVLGRWGELDTPGAAEAIELINFVIETGVYFLEPDTVSLYYPDNLFLHFAVLRAHRDGDVAALQPAVDGLLDDLRSSVIVDAVGRNYWDRGDPHMNTAFAALALMKADDFGSMTRGAIEYLKSEQDPATGSWDAGRFFLGRLDGGQVVGWFSAPFTTAIAMQALATWQIHQAAG